VEFGQSPEVPVISQHYLDTKWNRRHSSPLALARSPSQFDSDRGFSIFFGKPIRLVIEEGQDPTLVGKRLLNRRFARWRSSYRTRNAFASRSEPTIDRSFLTTDRTRGGGCDACHARVAADVANSFLPIELAAATHMSLIRRAFGTLEPEHRRILGSVLAGGALSAVLILSSCAHTSGPAPTANAPAASPPVDTTPPNGFPDPASAVRRRAESISVI
jgi:hypothetical protein